MGNFVHLHTHSCYSLMEASCSVDQLVDKAVSLGHSSLALTDEHNMSGIYEFNDSCKKKGVKPIFGLQISVTSKMSEKNDEDVNRFVNLLAKNKIGWKNLCILSSEAYISGYSKFPRIDYEILQRHSEGIILLSGGYEGHLARHLMYEKKDKAKSLIKWYKKVFGDDFYIEINYHPSEKTFLKEKEVADESIKLADEENVKCIFSNDVRYCSKEAKEIDAQDVLLCVKHHKIKKDSERRSLPSFEYYMKSREEMEKIYPNRPDLFDNTLEIESKIENNIIEKHLALLPKYQSPDGKDSIDYLKELVYNGLRKKNLYELKEYRDRVEWELKVFVTCGFVDYFLILYDFTNWARSNGISLGPGRGSCVGSLALYCLEITKLDPIKYELLFERFFSVDTKNVITASMFGISLQNPSIELEKNIQIQLRNLCAKHPEYNEQRFITEGKKMKQFRCLDDFLKIFSLFKNENINSGDLNECNSIIAYYCGITNQRPVADFSPKEELVAARVSPPDVDLDFDYHRRDEVFKYLKTKYGEKRVAQIGTSSYYKGKMTIKDVGKALDLAKDYEKNQEIERINQEKKIRGEKIELTKSKETLNLVDTFADMAEQGLSFIDAYKASEDLQNNIPEGTDYYHICSQIDGLVRQFSIHAAGAVICNRDLREIVPLRVAEDKSISLEEREDSGERYKVCTQWDKDQVEELGLCKYDLLALINISVINETIKLIKENHGIDIDIDTVDPNDEKVLKMLSEGKTAGVFQFETEGATRLLKNIGIDSFNDLVACNAINRPGPLMAGVGDLYADYKHGKKEIKYIHPSMEEVLKKTYGLIIYQEQIMMLSRVMAGFSKSEADKLRKYIGKKQLDKLAEAKEKFVSGCKSNGICESIASEVWQMIEYFGGYGFNLSHSLAYSYISFQEAYLKYYYPIEFFCCLFSSVIGNEDKFEIYRKEAIGDERLGVKGLGVKLWPVHINKSTDKYEIDRNGLRLPLTIVDGVGESAVKAIIAGQPYENFEDFVSRVDTSKVNINVIRNLSRKRFDAFACFNISGEEAVTKFELMKKDLSKRKMKNSRFVGGSLLEIAKIVTSR